MILSYKNSLKIKMEAWWAITIWQWAITFFSDRYITMEGVGGRRTIYVILNDILSVFKKKNKQPGLIL